MSSLKFGNLRVKSSVFKAKYLTMAIFITNDTLHRIDLDEEQTLLEFACWLYEKRRMSFGKARAISGKNHVEFQQALGDRGIYMHYDIEDFEEDMKTLKILESK